MSTEHHYYWGIPYNAEIRGSQFRPTGTDQWLNYETSGGNRFYKTTSSTAPSWYIGQGAPGTAGAPGTPGGVGPQGLQGPQGEQGERGAAGAPSVGNLGANYKATQYLRDPATQQTTPTPPPPAQRAPISTQQVVTGGYVQPNQLLSREAMTPLHRRRPIGLDVDLPWLK